MLADVLATRRPKLMAFFTAGDGGEVTTRQLVARAVAGGADLIELGIPFSDPIADGPAIQRASRRALEAGMTPSKALALASALQLAHQRPVVLLTYMNPFLRLRPEDIRAAGVEAVVIPDLSLEESPPVRERLRRVGIALVPFVAPTTPPERMVRIGRVADAFVYLVSVTGVTGARQGVADEALATIREARRHIRCPIAVGFGIATPDDARRLAEAADILIVGSALVEAYERGGADEVEAFCRSLRTAIDSVSLSL